MLETTKPLNVYCNGSTESGYASPATSGENSRRNSLGFKEYVRNRRFTMMSKFSFQSNRITVPIPTTTDNSRKNSSADSQFCDVPDDLEEELSPRPVYQRRMSVPEKVFLSSDYAILRPSTDADVKFEIVAAFDRNTDPYRHYMQSLTCYDLQPTHGAVVVIDGQLKIHKALTALSQCGHQAAVVTGIDNKGGISMLTVTDCLKAIVMASEGVHKVAEQTVSQFLRTRSSKKHIVYANNNTSIWEAAKMICLNRVHRIPIINMEESETPRFDADIMYILSLKTVFIETVLKLNEPNRSLCPHIKHRYLSEKKVGTWGELITVDESSTCSEAISLFLEKKISTLPVLNPEGRVLRVITKGDVMAELTRHPLNYLEILDLPVMDLLVNQVAINVGYMSMTIYDCITALVSSDRQSLVIVDSDQFPVGVVSYSDLMDYIQNLSSVNARHKLSLA